LSDDKPPPGRDYAILGPPTGDGGIHMIRHREDHTFESGVLRPVQEGKPISGEIIRLIPNEGEPGYDVETIYSPVSGGPAMVNSKPFREGWDRIFEKKDQKAEDLN